MMFSTSRTCPICEMEGPNCDGCSVLGAELTECEHDRNLCPDCVAESRCYDCRIEGMTASWRLM